MQFWNTSRGAGDCSGRDSFARALEQFSCLPVSTSVRGLGYAPDQSERENVMRPWHLGLLAAAAVFFVTSSAQAAPDYRVIR